jgi:hypothetical protein
VSKRGTLTSVLNRSSFQDLIDSGESFSSIANTYGVSSSSVQELADRWGVVLRETFYDIVARRFCEFQDDYISGNINCRVIADRLEVPVDSVRRFVRISKIVVIKSIPFDPILFDSCETIVGISAITGHAPSTVTKWAKKYKKFDKFKFDVESVKTQILKQWHSGSNVTQCSKEIGCSVQTASDIIKQSGEDTKRNTHVEIHIDIQSADTLRKLREQYTIPQIAKKYKVKNHIINTQIHKLGVFTKGTPRENIEGLYDKVLLEELYKTMSLEQMGEFLGCSHPIVAEMLDSFDILRKGIGQPSSYEHMVGRWLADYSPIFNDRTLLSDRKEIDIFLPDYNIGFEINGCYWHSEKFKPTNYHLDKKKDAAHNGIRLIHLFEDDLRDGPDLIRRKIMSLLEPSDISIGARKTKVVYDVDCKEFLEHHHIQGHVNHSFNIGLEHEGLLVSVATFKRYGDSHDLTRFASKLPVVGGLSKIMSKVTNVYTYADLLWTDFENNIYQKSGMSLTHQTKPDYTYYCRATKRRIPRRQMTRAKLQAKYPDTFCPELTEHQNALNHGFLKVYDCGKLKYTK